MQAQCAKVKENIQKKVQSLKPTYAIPPFIEYLCKDLPMSKNPVMEGSKMIKEINSDLEKRWQEFQKNDPAQQNEKIRELLHRNYLVYSRTDHYRAYLHESIHTSRNPVERFQKIVEELEKGERKPPFEWRMSLEKKMDPALLERLEKVRSDKFFQEYVHIKTQWLERVKDRKPEGSDKDFEAHKGYVETLPKLHEWIMDQRYFNFTNEKTEPYFRFLERDFNELKRRKVEQQRQMQSQGHIAPAVPQYGNQQVVNQHQNQHSYQPPQQRTQTNIQPNQQQMLHQQQQQPYANHSHSQQNPQYTQQEQNHQHYLNNKSHYTDPHAGPQINNNSLNQPSSYRPSYPTTGNNHTEAMNSNVNNQYSMPYDERDHHNSHTSHTSAQQYNSHDSHNSYSNQYQKPHQSSYSQQANTQQQQNGYNQQVKHNEQPFEWPSFSGPDSTFNQHNNSNFYSGSTNQNYSQAQSDNRNQYETNSAPYQQDFSEFFSHHDYADSYVADGKRHREDDVDFGNMTNYNPELQSDFVERKAENYHVQDFLQTSKKVKTNPSPQQELNIAQAKSNTIPSTLTPSTMEDGSPQAKLNGIDLSQVRKDTRFHIVDEVAYPSHLEITINRNDSGTMSAYEKISLKISQDGSKKIDIIDMANYDEFFKVFGNDLASSLHTGQLEHVLDLWIKFLDECAMRADSKLKEWEDIF